MRDLLYYWMLARKNIGRYTMQSEEDLRTAKTSDTLFIFGSGWSVNAISPEEWRHIAAHQTLSFNWFVHQDFLKMDYHLIKEISSNDSNPAIWKPQIRKYSELIKASPHYRDTIFVVQWGPLAININRLLGLRHLYDGAKIFPCSITARGIYREPTPRLADGLAQSCGTLSSCVNFAFLMGYTNIVLVGVDLNDRRYFWLREDETLAADKDRGATCADKHNMAASSLDVFARWTRWLGQRGVRLFCYNPHSLLAEVMPVYESLVLRLSNTA